MINLVERQEVLCSQYAGMIRAAEMCGDVVTVSSIAVGAERAFSGVWPWTLH